MKKKLNIGKNNHSYSNDMENKKYRKRSTLDVNFVDSPREKKEQKSSVSFFELFRFATPCDKLLIVLGILCTAVTGACPPFNMLNLGTVADTFVNYAVVLASGNVTTEATDEFFNGIIQYAIFNSIIGAVSLVFTILQTVFFNYAALSQSFRLRSIYFERVLNKDVGWYDTNQTGDFASRISEDLYKYEDGIGEKVVLFLQLVFTFIACLILALVRGWELALICIATLPVSIVVVRIVMTVTARLAKRELEAYAAAGAIAEEVLSTIRTVIAFGGQNKEIERYEEQLIFARKNNVKRSLFFGISMGLMWLLMYSSYGLAFWYGVGLVIKEMNLEDRTYTPGNMVTIFLSVTVASLNMSNAAPFLEAFGISTGAAAKVISVIDHEPVINKPNSDAKKLDKIQGRIVFKNVHFNYPSRSNVKVLQGVNITVEPGETVALVGSSGCGKSTCIQLIQRFYDPLDGEVQLDGVNVKDLDLRWLRSNFGVVGQEPVLFGTTISENIRYGNMSATQEDIQRAAKKANAHNFIMKLPDGYNTLVGERGAQLSGGQKQRIAIARALVREPTVLLLDEATSALDTNSEAKVQAALDAASTSCTTIIVAHRLSTIRAADKIFVFSNGQIVEEGTHEELMKKRGHYYTLVVTQVSGPDLEAMELSKGKSISYGPQYSEVEQDELLDEDEIPVDVKTKKVEPSGSALWSIIKLNSPEWWQITLGCTTSMVVGAAAPIFAVIFGDILGVLSANDPDYIRSETNIYCLYFVIMAVVVGTASFVQIPMYAIAGEKLVERLRKKMFAKILEQEMGWFDDEKNGVGNLCSRLSSEASSVQGATGQRIGTIFQALSTLGLAIGLSMFYEWRLGLVALAFFPFMIVFQFFHTRTMQNRNTGPRDDSSLENSVKIAVEAVSNIRTVASLGMEKNFHEQYVKALLPYQKSSKRGLFLRGLVLGTARSLIFFAFAVCMYYGGVLIRDENLDYSNVFKVSQALITGTFSLANALAFVPNFQKGLQSATKIFHLLNQEPKIKDAPNASAEEWERGNIRYSKIEFQYPMRPNVKVLKGLDLSVMSGKTVALVGPSGCGKSTMIQLLERFYDPTKGQIDVDGRNIKHMQLRSLRSHLGIVSQEPNLFDRTIAENIAYGDNNRKVRQEEIIEAAKKANIHNFISSLPLGYDTRLGERGVQLSGGQKQRVAIARALIRNPKVLLLDEATSALDNESEKVVQQALDAAREGRTCITIAHRLTTIKDADLICVINDGIVTEMGTHHQLIKQKGLYEKLYTLQIGSAN